MKILLPIVRTCSKTGKIIGLRKPEGFYKILFFATGLISLIWFLVRVIPKPSRARYPCMKATMPIAYSFIAYMLSLAGSVVFFRRAVSTFKARQFRKGIFVILVAALFSTWAMLNNDITTRADMTATSEFSDPLGANAPIGEAKGIFPLCLELDEAAKVSVEVYTSSGNRLLIKYLGGDECRHARSARCYRWI